MRGTLIDFDDSFTFNVVQELNFAGFEIEVIHWRDFESLPKEGALILGPGPGHPDDYQIIFPLVLEWLKDEKPFFGVCLGHQIFWHLHDEKVIRSKMPMHGQKLKLNLSDEWKSILNIHEEVYVQRYNSLAVHNSSYLNPAYRNFIQDEEILITLGEKLITYQFHPESVGTSFRKEFHQTVYSILNK